MNVSLSGEELLNKVESANRTKVNVPVLESWSRIDRQPQTKSGCNCGLDFNSMLRISGRWKWDGTKRSSLYNSSEGRGKEQDSDDKCAHASRYYGLYLLLHYFC